MPKDTQKVEAYGYRGLNNTYWRKIFANQNALEKWAEKNEGNITIEGTRDVE